jgi:hypothetical protein
VKPRLYYNWIVRAWICYTSTKEGLRMCGQGDTPLEAYSIWWERCAWTLTP